MAVAEKPPAAPALPGLPIEITPEMLAQAITLIQQQQAKGEDVLPAWSAAAAGAPIMKTAVAANGGDHLFYKQLNGWITSGQLGKGKARLHAHQDQGWTSLLDEYGLFDLAYEWYADHPMEVLLCRGGAKELPVAQVKALGWHLYPPLVPNCRAALGMEHKGRVGSDKHIRACWAGARPATFPQLEGQRFDKPEPCEFCDRTEFASDVVRNQHIRVLHQDEMKTIGAAREMAKQVGVVMGGMAAAVGKGTALPPRQPFACGLCDDGFDRPSDLTKHVKLHAENVDPSDGDGDGGGAE